MRLFRTLVLALGAASLYAQAPCGGTPAYTACDVVLEVAPRPGLELWAEFRAPDYKTYRLPAFPEGGRMRFRIAPLLAGNWTYRLSGNVKEVEGKIDQFSAAANPDEFRFIRRENAYHWSHGENLKPHLYMGAELASTAALDALAAARFTHLAVRAWAPQPASEEAFHRELAALVAAINAKGIVADIILAPNPAAVTGRYPTWQDRERFLGLMVGRYAAFNITWQLVETWEASPEARPLLKELGLALKKLDPYAHPRSTRSDVSAAPLGPDAWLDHVLYGAADAAIPAIEHQMNTAPQVALIDASLAPDEFRRRLWNMAMSGAYPAVKGALDPASPNAKTMTAWAEFFERTRHWDIEPYFDLDGGRALANPGIEYIVYVETPGKVTMTVGKHGYDVYWVNPASGEVVKEKNQWKFKADPNQPKSKTKRVERSVLDDDEFVPTIFEGTPPDATHDWVLHLSRDGKKQGMARSYKFESWALPVQEAERSLEKAPFELAAPALDSVLPIGAPVPYSIRLKRKTGGTRRMTYMVTVELARDGQGYRVVASGPEGSFTLPAAIFRREEGIISLRVAALNAPGKLYLADMVFSVKK